MTLAARYAPGQPRQKDGKFAGTGGFESAGAADAALGPAYGGWRGQLSPAEGQALGLYASSEYRTINPGLRAGQNPDPGLTAKLDRAVGSSAAPQDMTVYRGLGANAVPPGVKAGDSFSDKGFVSTSAARDKTGVFVSSAREEGVEPVLMKVSVRQGQQAAYIDGAAIGTHGNVMNVGEAEILLPRGSTFTVTGVGTEDFTAYGETFPVTVISAEVN